MARRSGVSVETRLRLENKKMRREFFSQAMERVKAEANRRERSRRRGHVAVRSLVLALSGVLSVGGIALGHKISGGCPKAAPRIVMESVKISPAALDGGAGESVGVEAGSGLIHGS